ncbi:5-carboxymethyl-2-hydroxymuconate Delta-isomerase [Bradyrhizobium canariense]|uniref:5-carboxymethyl-2-hydroxymuconate delta isomerase n=1 Tax=Bradyrhizobium canariense TaxID=255045 RepID=A0A1H1SLS9_9BRAD|nr:5-carboxymethyl-2-hydroxymuconate Delta-isomerase [Bradyrhizobium canariense]SDS48686.1 5-carboxymethyl-2-hydroxymuconate delta isomerase [Bradyrhizobium canariense]
MPHIVVEYSKNLEQSVDIPDLIRVVHDAVIATNAFPLEAVRTRGAPRDDFRIADGDPRNAFLAVVGRIAPGRPQQLRHELGKTLFDAIRGYLSDVSEAIPLSITVELQEIDQTSAFRHNSIVVKPSDMLAKS